MAELRLKDQAWLDQVREDIIDPDREIVDPHHHLWDRETWPYMLDQLWADTGDGHRVTETVFVECRSNYRADGPSHLRPLGETEFVTNAAARSRENAGAATIAGMVGHADLTLGADELGEVLDGHAELGGALFKGIRHSGARDHDPDSLVIAGRAPAGLYANSAFRNGLRELAKRGLSYDTWHYHHQNEDFANLAGAVPEATIVLDHFGTPLGVGRFAGKREEIFAQWKLDIASIARNTNVFAKLGGLAMPDNGFGWDKGDKPPTSDDVVAAQEGYYHHAIECFGPSRCMFESNFPVDRLSLSYQVYWNAMKKIASRYSESEQQDLFSSTARCVYRL